MCLFLENKKKEIDQILTRDLQIVREPLYRCAQLIVQCATIVIRDIKVLLSLVSIFSFLS